MTDLTNVQNGKPRIMYAIKCKECKKPLGDIAFPVGIEPTDDIKCTKCALKEFGI